MQDIGKRIRKYRLENDMTQEKLAEYLCVSYQAVSKWETGATVPDLSMIKPLTKLFRVTADELLGIECQMPDEERRGELERQHKQTYVSGDLIERYRIALAAVKEFPGDIEYLSWLADGEYFVSFEDDFLKEEGATPIEMMERSLRHYEIVFEECKDDSMRRSAILGLVMALNYLGRPEEGIPYAEQYPVIDGVTREDCLKYCYTGEKRKEFEQSVLISKLKDMCYWLSSTGTDEAVDTWENLIKLFIPDGNYFEFFDDMAMIKSLQSRRYAKAGDYDRAVEALRAEKKFAEKHDTIYYGDETYFDTPKVYRYSAPLFDMYERDMRERCVSGTGTHMEYFRENIMMSVFDPIRDRDDFKALVSE